jgi:hypothetical protein
MGSHVRRITTLGHDADIWPDTTISIHLLRAICLIFMFALVAFQARVGLSPNTNTVTNLDVGDARAHLYSFPYNLL